MDRPKVHDPLSVYVGGVLATARLSHGLTQNDVAAEMFVTGASISHYEHGHRQLHLRQFIELCSVLEVDPAAVIATALQEGVHLIRIFDETP